MSGIFTVKFSQVKTLKIPDFSAKFFTRLKFQPRDRLARYGYRSTKTVDEWNGGFRVEKRAKRHVAKADHYNIKMANSDRLMTPVGSIAKLLLESVMAQKNKTQLPR
jgi:hypothetical protein